MGMSTASAVLSATTTCSREPFDVQRYTVKKPKNVTNRRPGSVNEFDRTAEAVGEEERSVNRRNMEAREEEHIPMDECNAFRGISHSILAAALSLGLSFPGPFLLEAEEAEPFRTCAFLASRAKM